MFTSCKGFSVFPQFLRIGFGILLIIAIFIFSRSEIYLSSSVVSDGAMISVPVEYIMKGSPVELAQDDSRIRNFILKNGYLLKPSSLPYNLTKPKIDPSKGQGQMVRKLLKNMTNGFFVECGGLDGETRSNTLFLEKELQWRGLIVEADPKNFQLIQTKNRKAWTSNSCLATRSIPHEVLFHQDFNEGKIKSTHFKSVTLSSSKDVVKVQCFPLFSLLNAAGVTTVDYFSLDVEGNELDVLQHIPFDKLFIKILSVEFLHVAKGKKALEDFMKSKGYIVAGIVTADLDLANDFIFVHPSLKHLVPKPKT